MFNGKTNIVTSAADCCGKPQPGRSPGNSIRTRRCKEYIMVSQSRFTILFAAAAITALGAVVSTASANMIQNGDFSVTASAYLSGWTTTYPTVYGGLGVQGPGSAGGMAPGPSDNVFPPASVTSGQQHFAYLQGGLVSPTSATLSPASLSQSFATAVGGNYLVTFYAAQCGYDATQGHADIYAQLQVQVTDSNNNVLATANSNTGGGLTINANSWTANTFNFTADTTSTILTFADAPNSAPGETVDFTAVEVSTAPVPEPAALGLLAIGGGLGLLIHKRRRVI